MLDKEKLKHAHIKYHIPEWISLLCIVLLLFMKTGFEDRLIYRDGEQVRAKVLKVYNENIQQSGVVLSGEQGARVLILDGSFKGEEYVGTNFLSGNLTNDTIYEEGDIARVLVNHKGGAITFVNLIDHNRIPYEIAYFALFAILITVVAGRTGFRSLLSFVLSILAIWKLLIPYVLKGANPILLGLVIISAITVFIILPIYGICYRSLSAILGALLGILATLLLGLIGTRLFHLTGTVMPQSESLLYAVSGSLNLTEIFIMSVFIGASGAIMDLAVDITAAVAEVIAKKPSMEWPEAFRSGMNVGRASMGTMTTTLLLAYSGGYITLLMVFMAQGTPLLNILNFRDVAAEILHTLVGSIGLVLVTPATALVAAILLCSKGKLEIIYNEYKQLKEEGLLPEDTVFCPETFIRSGFRQQVEKSQEAK